MSRPDPEWIAQLRMYDPPDPVPADRLWHSPLGSRVYPIPLHVQAIYGHDCAGRPIIRPRRDHDTFTVSIDHKGYERRRGTQEVVVRWPDGSAVLGLQRDGEFRGFRRSPDHDKRDEWNPDPSALKEAFTIAGIDGMDDGVFDRWARVSHHATLKRWVMSFLRGAPGVGLYLHGGTGCGKTTAVNAVLAECKHNGKTVLYLDTPALARQMRAGYSDSSTAMMAESEIQTAYRVDVLGLDDLTAVPKKDDLFMTLHTLIDRRQADNKPTIVGDNCRPGRWEAEGLDKRLASRLHAFKPIDFGDKDWRKEPNP